MKYLQQTSNAYCGTVFEMCDLQHQPTTTTIITTNPKSDDQMSPTG